MKPRTLSKSPITKTAVLAAAFSALASGCAVKLPILQNPIGPKIAGGIQTLSPLSARTSNGWAPLPGTFVRLSTDQYPPRLTAIGNFFDPNVGGIGPVILTRQATPDTIAQNNDCSRVVDRARLFECAVAPSFPEKIVFETNGYQYIDVSITNCRMEGINQAVPGTNARDSFMRAVCYANGDYSHRKFSEPNAVPVPIILNGRPAVL